MLLCRLTYTQFQNISVQWFFYSTVTPPANMIIIFIELCSAKNIPKWFSRRGVIRVNNERTWICRKNVQRQGSTIFEIKRLKNKHAYLPYRLFKQGRKKSDGISQRLHSARCLRVSLSMCAWNACNQSSVARSARSPWPAWKKTLQVWSK